MLKYILKRLGYALLILFGVSIILYILVRCMPVDIVERKVAEMNQGGAVVDEATIQAMKEMYGLTDSSFLGMLKGYWSWFAALCRLDLGTSFLYGSSVLEDIVDHMGVSFMVSFIAIIFEYMIAIPLGVTAATHQYSLRDYLVTIFVVIGISLPSFFFAQILKAIFASNLGWFPSGTLEDVNLDIPTFLNQAWHLVLPVVTLVILGVGGTMRYTRTNMLEVLNSDYIRTARAKGLPESKVIYKHAFRNTMIPIVTMMAGILPGLFSGSMILEQVFDLPGIGQRALNAMLAGDIPYIMGYNMFLAFLSVIGVLLSDLMYGIVDPRIKLA